MDSLLRENRVFPPPAEFAAKAHIRSLEEYEAMYQRSVEEPEAFWAEAAGELDWFAPWDKVLDWNGSQAKWFVGGKLNLSHNCVDRHAQGARRDKVALLWEGEPGEVRRADLRRAACAGAAVCQCAEGAGHQEGRSRGDLHGHVSGAGDCDAGVRADRRGALGDLRRVRGAGDCGPGERFGVRGDADAGCELPARHGGAS